MLEFGLPRYMKLMNFTLIYLKIYKKLSGFIPDCIGVL